MLKIQPVLALSLFVSTAFPAAAVFAADKNNLPVETRVERLERRIGRLSELMLQVDRLKRENSELRGQIEEQNNTIESLRRRQRDLYIDIDQRLTALQNSAPAGTSASAPAPVSAPVPEPVTTPVAKATPVEQSATTSSQEEKDYKAAFELLSPSQRRYPEAIKALSAFLDKYPGSKLADNAQYWLAEANYVTQKNDVAMAEFNKLLELYPNSPKVPGSLLKIGYLLHSGGQINEAKTTLNKVINTYPGGSAANMAKKRLQRIQNENR